jgi:hypothetical protein
MTEKTITDHIQFRIVTNEGGPLDFTIGMERPVLLAVYAAITGCYYVPDMSLDVEEKVSAFKNILQKFADRIDLFDTGTRHGKN